jgi:hypothetical protein
MSRWQRVSRLAAVTAAAWLALGCARGGGDASPPARAPDIAGTVTHVSRSGERTVTVRVEERPADVSGSAKASVRVTESTRVIRGGRVVSEREIREGARVSAWFTGPVAESYPVQARAEAVRIEEDSPRPDDAGDTSVRDTSARDAGSR